MPEVKVSKAKIKTLRQRQHLLTLSPVSLCFCREGRGEPRSLGFKGRILYDGSGDMSESVDLRRILKSWPYDPDKETRIVPGDDGRSILQVRTPLGIEQYELDGRPDGAHPYGKESALEHHLERLEKAKAAGLEAEFGLGPRECGELFSEGTLYYFRYVRLFQLKEWERTVRDTATCAHSIWRTAMPGARRTSSSSRNGAPISSASMPPPPP
jgi:hypothetical protein